MAATSEPARSATDLLHATRRRELDLLFGRVPPGTFATGLELGAGDGYQSTLLTRWVRRLTSTDYWGPPPGEPSDAVEYRRCDAERVDEELPDRRFDLVFSSNMMEHVPDPQRVLDGTRRVMAPGALAVHVMPTPFWKATHLAGFWPSRARTVIRALRRRQAALAPLATDVNNPHKDEGSPPRRALLVPPPHGADENTLAELWRFSRRRWRSEFERAGYVVVAEIAGPVTSGYGFGLDATRRRLEVAGVSSETGFVVRPAGDPSPYEPFLTGDAPRTGAAPVPGR